jgi:predicted  nucleic acid-binding Zn-ribbon protein
LYQEKISGVTKLNEEVAKRAEEYHHLLDKAEKEMKVMLMERNEIQALSDRKLNSFRDQHQQLQASFEEKAKTAEDMHKHNIVTYYI